MKLKKPKPPKLPKGEAEQISIRRRLGHEHGLKIDVFGRTRLYTGTAESLRQYEEGARSGIVRVRNIDPLIGISSLSDQQRKAGEKYRKDYEFCATEGLKTPGLQVRVDGGKLGGLGVADVLLAAHRRLSAARSKVGYREIIDILDSIVGQGVTLRSLEAQTGNPRVVIVNLLKMGLERLTSFYGRRG
jgi:hypothetical protein